MHESELVSRKQENVFLAALIVLSLVPFALPLLRFEVFDFRDHSDYFVPLRYFTAEQIAAGSLPLWNPYNASGEPWSANPQTGLFYPPAWLFLVLPFTTAYVLYLTIHVLFLSIGSYFLFRLWSQPAASFLASLILAGGGATLSLLDVSNNLASFAYVPVLLVGAWAPEGRRRIPVPVSALALALCFMAGEPFVAAVAVLLYAAVAMSRRPLRLSLKEIGLAGLLAALLSSVQLIPFVAMLHDSDRLAGLPISESLRQSLHPRDWFRSFVPSAAGAGSQGFIASLYLGPWAGLGCIASILLARSGKNKRVVLAWSLLLAGVVFFAAGRFNILLPHLPWMGGLRLIRYPARLVPFGALAIAALSALGLDALRRTQLDQRRLVGFLAVLLLIVSVSLGATDGRGGWLVLAGILSTLFSTVIFCGYPRELSMRAILLLGVFTTAGFMMTAAPLLGTSSFEDPENSVLPAQLLPGRKIARLLASPGRIEPEIPQSLLTDREAWLAGYLNLMHEKFDSETASPVRHAPYERLLNVAKWTPRTDVLRFLSVGYFLAPPDLPISGMRRLSGQKSVILYQDPLSYPMVRLWRNVRRMKTDDDALRAILMGEKIDRRVFVTGLVDDHVAALEGGRRTSRPDRLRVRAFGLNRVEVEVAASAPAILTLNQIDASGWKVERDGIPTTSLHANGMFRAVYVPEGVHRFVWSYRPPTFTLGLTITVLTALALLIISLRQRKMRHDA